jgi:hypothetical protein
LDWTSSPTDLRVKISPQGEGVNLDHVGFGEKNTAKTNIKQYTIYIHNSDKTVLSGALVVGK